MPAACCIDPDDFLDLGRATQVSREDVRAAWELAYGHLAAQLDAIGADATLYVVYGLQAAGKSTWVREQAAVSDARAIFFSGPLPSKRHRERAVALGRAAGCRVVGVWVQAPWTVARSRNAHRPGLACISEAAMRDVWDKLEPPSLDEGFDAVQQVQAGA